MIGTTENFYVQKKDYWVKFYRSYVDNKKVQQTVFQKYLTPEKIPELIIKTQQEFEELLPQIPDFGRKEITTFSREMIRTALSLAFYRVLKADGYDVHTIGQMIYEVSDAYYRSINPIKKFIMRRIYFSSSRQKKFKKALEERNSVDPEDYHCAFVEGDQENLLWGVNYTSCGGLKFLKHQNALEIAPYLCLCDYPMYRAINVGFNRNQNLAIGGTMCAFRFYRDYPTPKGWPPEEVVEYKDFKFMKEDL